MTERELVENTDKFLLYPKHRIGGVFDTLEQANATFADILALQEEGLSEDEVMVLHGAEWVERLDIEGKKHGLAARIARMAQRLGGEHEILTRWSEALAAGKALISAPGQNDAQRQQIIDIMRNHQSYDMHYFGHVIEDIPSQPLS